jgi:hypothetical protein
MGCLPGNTVTIFIWSPYFDSNGSHLAIRVKLLEKLKWLIKGRFRQSKHQRRHGESNTGKTSVFQSVKD